MTVKECEEKLLERLERVLSPVDPGLKGPERVLELEARERAVNLLDKVASVLEKIVHVDEMHRNLEEGR